MHIWHRRDIKYKDLKQNVIILFKNAIKDVSDTGTKAPADFNSYAAYTYTWNLSPPLRPAVV